MAPLIRLTLSRFLAIFNVYAVQIFDFSEAVEVHVDQAYNW